MSDDLVKRLREFDSMDPCDAMTEAADRIERLEAELKQRDSYLVSKDLWCDFVWSVTND